MAFNLFNKQDKQDKKDNNGNEKAFFWNKTPKVLAMIGSSEIVDYLAQKGFFEDYNIELENRDYATVDELLSGLKKSSNAKYVLLSDSALEGYGVDNAIKHIREQFPNLIIAVFFNDAEYSERFQNWAYGHKVYHLYYSEDGNFNFEVIAKELSEANVLIAPSRSEHEISDKENSTIIELEKKIDQNEQNAKREINVAKEQIEQKDIEIQRLKSELEQAKLKEKTSNNQEEVSQIQKNLNSTIDAKTELEYVLSEMQGKHLQEMQGLQEEMRELQEKIRMQEQVYKKELAERDKIEEDLIKQNEEIRAAIKASKAGPTLKAPGTGTIMTIGIFAISSGAGSTYTSIALAEALGEKGYSTVIVPMDLKEDISCIELQYSHAFAPDTNNNKDMLVEAVNQQWDFIIQDFGRVFPINANGNLESGDVSNYIEDVKELKRCSLKIAVGFSEPWHIDRFRYFIENPVLDKQTTIYVLKDADKIKGIDKLNLQICRRDEDIISNVLHFLNIEREVTRETSKSGKRNRFLGI